MKMKLLSGFLFCLALVLPIQGQNIDLEEQEDRCHTMENYERLKRLFPEYEQNRRDIEQQISRIINQREVIDGITVIPVVFHVIHNGDAVGTNENVSDALLQAQLDQMNDDYRRTNSDAGNTPSDFTGVAADSEIEFCFAQIDPDGDPTTGINRTDISDLSGVDEADCWYKSYIDANIKIPTIWDRDNYLNIWTVVQIHRDSDCANTILGYAQFPGGPANTDGVVLKSKTVGSLASPNPIAGDYRYGRTGTHEVGHYLNLYHMWGANSTGCGVDDQVSDTPVQDGPNYTGTPCTYPGPNSCDEGTGDLPDMFQNFMDYSDDLCMNLFTQGQADRMSAAITASRSGLLSASCGDCEEDMVISGTLSGTYNANNSIVTSGVTTIPSSNDVIFRASSYVRLNGGFSTAGYAGLSIGFGDCSSPASTIPTHGTSEIEYIRTPLSFAPERQVHRPVFEETKFYKDPLGRSRVTQPDNYSLEELARLNAIRKQKQQ